MPAQLLSSADASNAPLPPLIADLREEYNRERLTIDGLASDPIAQFRAWFDDALAADIPEPNAMALATVTANGHPTGRIVLLKALDGERIVDGTDARGFVFYTNYTSRKGQELAAHPHAALVFWWHALERQVRIEGAVAQVAPAESDAYFAQRPRGSQLGAWASPQSEFVPNREALETRLRHLTVKYGEGANAAPIPRPPHWGGYRVVPRLIEFWQGGPKRLHDRFQYLRTDDGWHVDRLAP
ncbi:MAG: pyridoxamine 5'-phosphate oxidase [Bacteroidota bacterium]